MVTALAWVQNRQATEYMRENGVKGLDAEKE